MVGLHTEYDVVVNVFGRSGVGWKILIFFLSFCFHSLQCMFYVSGVTILLSLTVFLNMVAETMPATSDAVPLLGRGKFPNHFSRW